MLYLVLCGAPVMLGSFAIPNQLHYNLHCHKPHNCLYFVLKQCYNVLYSVLDVTIYKAVLYLSNVKLHYYDN